jgi:cell division protein FtsA
MVKSGLEASGLSRIAGARVVLTGGGCQLAGARELAAQILGKQVRLGRPIGLRGLPDAASGPAFATGAGLLAWASGEGRVMQDIDLETRRPSGPLKRFVTFLRERV